MGSRKMARRAQKLAQSATADPKGRQYLRRFRLQQSQNQKPTPPRETTICGEVVLGGMLGAVLVLLHLMAVVILNRYDLLPSVFGRATWAYFSLVDTENASASGFGASARRYSGAENVRVVPIVAPELKFRDIQS
jgi:hypothetical protein